MPQVASMGAAVSIVDVDRDGWQDIYVTNSGEGSHNHLYRNLGDGTFQDVAVAMGIADVNQEGTGVSMGAVWGDYDNDGYEDLLLYKWGRPELFRNEQGHRFVRVTELAGLPRWINANTAIWLDYDRDGRLDLFIGGYYAEQVNLWQLTTTRMMPESFEYAQNGGRKYILRNHGDGNFVDVTEQLDITSRRWALAATAADLRRSGYPDLFIANDYGVSELYFNDGSGRFREVGKQTGVGFTPKSGMNVAVGDILNQGQFAIYVTNISEAGVLLQGNNLWVPKAGTAGEHLTYENLARAMGVELGGWSFGAQFGDLNNDGHLDLYLTNGYISADRERSYWYDFSKVAGGNTAIIADAQNWPAMAGRSLSGYQQKHVWLNDGAGQFFDVAQVVGVTDTYDGRAVALADLWNRGVLDVVAVNQKGPLLLYKNTVRPDHQWIAFELEGRVSNRSAIGTQVRLFWNGQEQVQEVSGGSGFGAQNQRRLHFGLGQQPHIDKVVIRWPSGKVQTLMAPQSGHLHRLKEPV
jgi:enediyne biosynthesis protein E4